MSRRVSLVVGLLLSPTYAGSAWAHGGGPGLSFDPCAKRALRREHLAALHKTEMRSRIRAVGSA
ncbi:MAG: hypothetical protein Q7S58_03595 [Candidatus Binatus sp.]|uniref:hypothetical protein n=1 Tax=Candidatus Binatus sp. TaxID=2811406 RepID=UPI002717AA66|nr:hypothetical protein [Candidatus Binatus sp.]MDO8431473.1 hypothetical protein [Candidatus Binatus sp.]